MNRLTASLVVEVAIILIGSGCGRAIEGVKQEGSALRFKMKSLDGREIDLARYEGKVVMVVNVASKCGYTPQYAQLQTLYEQYADKGFVILGFPCNQFLGQEPGSAEEIKEFCRLNYGVTFDMFAKVDVNGENACELYKLLTSLDTEPKGAGKIGWNFEKFILDRQGFVVARFASGTKPNAPEIVAAVEKELAEASRSGEADSAGGQHPRPEFDLTDYRWKNRILLLFAPSGNDANYKSFRSDWDRRGEAVADRDLLMVEVLERSDSRLGDTRLGAASAAKLRKQFQIESGSTMFILIGKDGTEKLRKETVKIEDLFEVIDAMPMRKREAESRNPG